MDMCGRTSLFADQQVLEDRFDATVGADEYTPQYNIAPGDDLEVIAHDAPETIAQYHWGFVPDWTEDPNDGLINARSETAAEKSTFAEAWATRPCLVLSSGFYEWQSRPTGTKQPYRVHRKDTPVFAMAGLWEPCTIAGTQTRCVTILTTTANELMAPLHDRMPVVLAPTEERTWLTGDQAQRAALCRPYPKDDLTAYEISQQVNSPTNDNPEIIAPIEHAQSGLDEFTSA